MMTEDSSELTSKRIERLFKVPVIGEQSSQD